MSEQRAEGFWWVRWRPSQRWEVIEVRRNEHIDAVGAGMWLIGQQGTEGPAQFDDDRWEWGQYLGDGPDDDSVVASATARARAQERERVADWLRFHGDDEAYQHDVTCVCGDWNTDTPAPSVSKLADAIEAMTDEEGESA